MKIIIFALLASLNVMTTNADDGAAEVGAGSVEFKKTDAISMDTEDLFLSQDIVRIKFGFRNNSHSDFKTTVAFPLPPFGASDPTGNGINSHFAYGVAKTFSVISNGKKITPKIEIRAWNESKEITTFLKKYGIPLEDEGKILHAFNKLSPADKKKFVDAKLITENIENKMKDTGVMQPTGTTWVDDTSKITYEDPSWEIRKIYYWEQTFPAKSITTLEHEYTPGLGSGYTWSIPMPEEIKKFCVDSTTQNTIKKVLTDSAEKAKKEKKDSDPPLMGVSNLKYILLSANTWSGPIKEFKMTVQKRAEKDIVSFCMDNVKKTGPKTFQVNLKNFTPTRDLDILFLSGY